MSCLRIRSSRRSRGPSYTSLTATAKGESLVSFFATVLAVFEEWVGLPEVSTGISTPETAFTSSLILVIVPTTSRFRIVAQVRTPATCPSRHVLPPWWKYVPRWACRWSTNLRDDPKAGSSGDDHEDE